MWLGKIYYKRKSRQRYIVCGRTLGGEWILVEYRNRHKAWKTEYTRRVKPQDLIDLYIEV
jgi:hypothetical protein